MSDGVDEVRGDGVTVRFEGSRCIHARQCVLGNPRVFVPDAPGEWIHPGAASVEEVVRIAHACPSGAIGYLRHDGGPQESPPAVNVVRVRENGPLAFHGELRLQGHAPMFRATLCRCGASKAKPFCDTAHLGAGFTASGEPATAESGELARRDGPVELKPARNGPLLVNGSLEVVSGTGRTIARMSKAAFCRCGHSSNKPFCDGTHSRVGFKAD